MLIGGEDSMKKRKSTKWRNDDYISFFWGD